MKTNEEMLLEMTAALLGGAVNFYLNELDETLPQFEIDVRHKLGGYGVVPVIDISECELSDKERVIKLQAYTLKISFSVKGSENKRLLYVYAYAIEQAINDDVTFGGVADRVALVHKKYSQKTADLWEIVISVRAVVETMRKE
jgi:hypothetical protein